MQGGSVPRMLILDVNLTEHSFYPNLAPFILLYQHVQNLFLQKPWWPV